MASLAEVRANTGYYLARNVGEWLIPPIQLQFKEEVTPDSVQQLTSFEDRAHGFYSIYFSGIPEPEIKAEALINLAQELINLGRFKQARELLNKEPPKFFRVTLPTTAVLPYYQARVEEKLGWIADYETGYFESLRRFTAVRGQLERIPRSQWREQWDDLYSTTTHFLGRGHYGLASQGIRRDANTRQAIFYFQEDLRRFRTLREQGNPQPANEGFQHGWLARCYFLLENQGEAGEEIHHAQTLFQEFIELHPKSGIMAHYHLLNGQWLMNEGYWLDARARFREALKIREEVEPYPKGYADAEAGIAMTYWKEGKVVPTIEHLAKAVKTHPFIVLKDSFGG